MSGEPVSVAQPGRPWGWALAFLWMPALALALLAASSSPYLVLSMPIAAAGIGVGARKVARCETFPLRKLWFWLNVVMCALWTFMTTMLLFIMALRAAGFRFAP